MTDTTVPEVKNSRTEFEFAHLVGENADRGRSLRHLDREDVLEDVRRQDDIELLAGHVDDPAADHAQHEIEDNGDAHADRQGDERGNCAVRHDAIIDVHNEKRARQCQHVHDQRGGRDMAVIRPEAADDRPEPVGVRQVTGGDGARIGGCGRADKECKAQIFVGKLVEGARLGSGIRARVDDRRNLGVEVDRQQYTGRAIAHRKDGWQHEGRDFRQAAAQRLGLEARLRGGALEQRGR